MEKILRVDCVGAWYQDDGNLTCGPARKFFFVVQRNLVDNACVTWSMAARVTKLMYYLLNKLARDGLVGRNMKKWSRCHDPRDQTKTEGPSVNQTLHGAPSTHEMNWIDNRL